MSRQNSQPMVIYTIGHGNRPIDAFLALLAASGVKALIDVRAQPDSQRFPQFGSDALRHAVNASGMEYHWAGRQFGGRRQPRPDSPHVALADDGRRGFAVFMQTDLFRKGIDQLLHLARGAPCALLCAERRPADCHRALIADYLTAGGARVLHLVEPEVATEHRLNPAARWDGTTPIYDRCSQPSLPLGD
ncbi:MAG: hypothetical protein A2150_02010 [Candidatus Muproteobacteria bacterium RBG_16_64_11]|uniref:DNA repair protein n=1 Tax=Candidatus Muproteobacteria bacterium RBG_16_64_11 TaxID=1817758 RepID=A0A1F6T903_9PROT|nr:MAG: hypothetical protein A2150_02010 [Candidatus Muproteobacteria bacterium RBG_16_64_11]